MRTLRLLTVAAGTTATVLLAAALLVALGHGPADSWARLGSVGSGSADPDVVLPAAFALAAWACVVWLSLGVLLGALSALPGAVGSVADGVATRVTPAAVRRLGRLAVGATLVTGVVAGALPASAATAPQAPTASSAAWADLDWQAPATPAAPAVESTVPAPPAPAPTPTVRAEPTALSTPLRAEAAPAAAERAGEVVVVRGDTLWSLAARTLGPDATDAEVATEWHRWYETNRDVIGSDPDLLQPGQRLLPPA